jgi:hypothetical protein
VLRFIYQVVGFEFSLTGKQLLDFFIGIIIDAISLTIAWELVGYLNFHSLIGSIIH